MILLLAIAAGIFGWTLIEGVKFQRRHREFVRAFDKRIRRELLGSHPTDEQLRQLEEQD